MAHFAEINENNVVTQVVVVDDMYENNGQDFLAVTCGLGGTWIKTSYNTLGGVHQHGGTPFRKNYAGVGSIYDSELDAFYLPQPYPSWVLDQESCLWEPPVARPNDGKDYVWNEETTSWDEMN